MQKVMPFSEERFPLDLSLSASGGAAYSTNINTTINGHEQRNINWQNARAHYELSPKILDNNQLENLVVFFRAHKGKAIGFRFRDWADYSAVNESLGQGDGENCNFQLQKVYAIGNVSDRRTITKPVEGTLKIWVDGSEGEYESNYSTGVVSLKFPPSKGSLVSASFEFDVPVRFDADHLDISLESGAAVSIPIIEIKVQP